MEADEVTVVVVGARDLEGKKPGRFKYSVIFGVGNKKFRTSVVEDPFGNPDWNEETNVPVQNKSDHVFFTVMEKDDVLGHVKMPVTSLSTDKDISKTTLKAHRKCPLPHGDLLFQAYVSKYRSVSDVVNSQTLDGNTSFGVQMRNKLAGCPDVPRRERKHESKDKEKRKGRIMSYFSTQLPESLHNILHTGHNRRNDEEEEEQKTSNRSKSDKIGDVDSGLDHTSDTPLVTSIIPKEATVHGGTRLCIEGRKLGLGKSDIMEFLLCGSDLLDTIEFESDTRIYVTTKPSTAGKGDLWIETVSGGRNVVQNAFTFVDSLAEKNGPLEREASPSPTNIPPSPAREAPLLSTQAALQGTPVCKEGTDLNASNISKPAAKRSILLRRSSSQQAKKASSSLLVGSPSSPRVRTTDDLGPFKLPEVPIRSNKKNSRRSNESTVALQRKSAGVSSTSEKSELQLEIVRLMKENEVLKKKNDDLNQYIQNLVAKVMETCPDVLAAMPEG